MYVLTAPSTDPVINIFVECILRPRSFTFIRAVTTSFCFVVTRPTYFLGVQIRKMRLSSVVSRRVA